MYIDIFFLVMKGILHSSVPMPMNEAAVGVKRHRSLGWDFKNWDLISQQWQEHDIKEWWSMVFWSNEHRSRYRVLCWHWGHLYVNRGLIKLSIKLSIDCTVSGFTLIVIKYWCQYISITDTQYCLVSALDLRFFSHGKLRDLISACIYGTQLRNKWDFKIFSLGVVMALV